MERPEDEVPKNPEVNANPFDDAPPAGEPSPPTEAQLDEAAAQQGTDPDPTPTSSDAGDTDAAAAQPPEGEQVETAEVEVEEEEDTRRVIPLSRGRSVLYTAGVDDRELYGVVGALAFLAEAYPGDRNANVLVIHPLHGTQHWRPNVQFLQPDDEIPDHSYAHWMPYQVR